VKSVPGFTSSAATIRNNSFEQWESEGSLDHAQRCNARYKKMLAEYEAPALDPAIDEALLAYIKQRKDSMPDSMT
jgi:trimethylamine--corrinoid protein Co-methyltransferase